MVDETRTAGQPEAPVQTPAALQSPLVLVQFPPVWGRNFSPFTLKLETWLRLARVPYTVRYQRNPGFSPKGKLPYVIENSRRIGDSGLIIEHLKRSRLIDPDAWLDARQLAESLALQRMFEEHLYGILIYARWLDPDGWAGMDKVVAGIFPPPVHWLAGRMLRRRMRQDLHRQGIGRHSQREIYAMARADLAAVSIMLGSRRFFMGEQTSTIDAVAYGFLANILLVPLDTELRRIAEDFPNLRRFCERIDQGLERASLRDEADAAHIPAGA